MTIRSSRLCGAGGKRLSWAVAVVAAGLIGTPAPVLAQGISPDNLAILRLDLLLQQDLAAAAQRLFCERAFTIGQTFGPEAQPFVGDSPPPPRGHFLRECLLPPRRAPFLSCEGPDEDISGEDECTGTGLGCGWIIRNCTAGGTRTFVDPITGMRQQRCWGTGCGR
jgi:hypothetical protein